jgi:hypothetical protein
MFALELCLGIINQKLRFVSIDVDDTRYHHDLSSALKPSVRFRFKQESQRQTLGQYLWGNIYPKFSNPHLSKPEGSQAQAYYQYHAQQKQDEKSNPSPVPPARNLQHKNEKKEPKGESIRTNLV